ncbi:MAG: hypothetical protein K6T83_10930 [Alicyclobacillus sp.]|nr:hypothetical protein [Alicyclobacillus sp.]
MASFGPVPGVFQTVHPSDDGVAHFKVYAERIEVLDRERVVANHLRSHQHHQTVMGLGHCLPVLAYKPHAATYGAVVGQLPEVYQRIRVRT